MVRPVGPEPVEQQQRSRADESDGASGATQQPPPTRIRRRLVLVAVVLAIAVIGLGIVGSLLPSHAAAKVDDIANMVPEDIKASGKLVIGVNLPYPPNEFKDSSGELSVSPSI